MTYICCCLLFRSSLNRHCSSNEFYIFTWSLMFLVVEFKHCILNVYIRYVCCCLLLKRCSSNEFYIFTLGLFLVVKFEALRAEIVQINGAFVCGCHFQKIEFWKKKIDDRFQQHLFQYSSIDSMKWKLVRGIELPNRLRLNFNRGTRHFIALPPFSKYERQHRKTRLLSALIVTSYLVPKYYVENITAGSMATIIVTAWKCINYVNKTCGETIHALCGIMECFLIMFYDVRTIYMTAMIKLNSPVLQGMINIESHSSLIRMARTHSLNSAHGYPLDLRSRGYPCAEFSSCVLVIRIKLSYDPIYILNHLIVAMWI